MATQIPTVPAQPVSPIDFMGVPPLDAEGSPGKPPTFTTTWYIFLNALRAAMQVIADSVAALATTVSGTALISATQSQLAALAMTAAIDALVEVTDYAHVLRWTGATWEWGPGENGSGMLVPFAVAPTGSGWHLCDGSAGVSYLKADGTLGTVTLPDTAGSPAYLNLGPAYSATITAATVPTISAPVFTGTPLTTGVESADRSINNGTGGTLVGAGAVITNIPAGAHVHAFTPFGTVSAPTATLPGDPIASFPAPLYFRM